MKYTINKKKNRIVNLKCLQTFVFVMKGKNYLSIHQMTIYEMFRDKIVLEFQCPHKNRKLKKQLKMFIS